jgi:serine/threonine protein kinase
MFDYVKTHGRLRVDLAKSLFLQILDAVDYLHSEPKLAHLDLKLENVLIDEDFKLKLCDFGFSEEIRPHDRIWLNKGSDGYKAPEIYSASSQGFEATKADIFSLGVILFILIFGVPPFSTATKENVLYRYFYKGV